MDKTPTHTPSSASIQSSTPSKTRTFGKSCCVDDPRESSGRRNQLVKILGIATIPVIILTVQSSLNVHDALFDQWAAVNFKADVEFATQASKVIHALQLERGTTVMFLSTVNSTLMPTLIQRQTSVNKAMSGLTRWPKGQSRDNELLLSQETFLRLIQSHRFRLNSTTSDDQLTFYTDLIGPVLTWIGDAAIQSQGTADQLKELAGYNMFISAKELFAAERGAGSAFYGLGRLPKGAYLWVLDKRSRGQDLLNKSMQFSPYISDRVHTLWYGSNLQYNITKERNLIDDNNLTTKDPKRGAFWFEQMTRYQDMLLTIEDALLTNITKNVEETIRHSRAAASLQLFIAIFSGILLPLIIMMLYRITGEIQTFAVILQRKHEEIMREKRRSEKILGHLLPRQIVKKLKMGITVEPEYFDEATIFFSDIVQFTDFSAKSTPMQVVETLNRLYTTMDKRIETYDVYKVETIGDAYLCASGLPERNGNKHSYEIAAMSLELVDDVSTIKIHHQPDYELKMRIGLNTGPCMAGIIGTKMPRYCLFGDTVNTASRMESHGEPLRIHITSRTYECLNEHGSFVMELRGDIPDRQSMNGDCFGIKSGSGQLLENYVALCERQGCSNRADSAEDVVSAHKALLHLH